jgi:hypothetical protein
VPFPQAPASMATPSSSVVSETDRISGSEWNNFINLLCPEWHVCHLPHASSFQLLEDLLGPGVRHIPSLSHHKWICRDCARVDPDAFRLEVFENCLDPVFAPQAGVLVTSEG